MPADVQIRFKAQSAKARREISQLTQEVRDLHQGLGQTDRSATAATQGVGRLGTAAQTAAVGVTSLGRNIFKTSAEARKFGGVFADVTGRLHEANGQYAQTRERIDRLGDEARESASEVQKLGNALENTGQGYRDSHGVSAVQAVKRGVQGKRSGCWAAWDVSTCAYPFRNDLKIRVIVFSPKKHKKWYNILC